MLKFCIVFILNFGRKRLMIIKIVRIIDISVFVIVDLVKIFYIYVRSK